MMWVILSILFFIIAVSAFMGVCALARSLQLGRKEREEYGDRYDQ